MSEPRALPIAGCSCGEPLICTLAFRRFEFYCVGCGRKLGFLEPRRLDPTPENAARLKAVEEEWVRLGGPDLLGEGAYHDGCERCRDEPHAAHATAQEFARHDAALVALAARTESPVRGVAPASRFG